MIDKLDSWAERGAKQRGGTNTNTHSNEDVRRRSSRANWTRRLVAPGVASLENGGWEASRGRDCRPTTCLGSSDSGAKSSVNSRATTELAGARELKLKLMKRSNFFGQRAQSKSKQSGAGKRNAAEAS